MIIQVGEEGRGTGDLFDSNFSSRIGSMARRIGGRENEQGSASKLW